MSKLTRLIPLVPILLGGTADAAPNWCTPMDDVEAREVADLDGPPERSLAATAYLTCHGDELDSGERKKLDAARTRVAATFGLTADDWADVAPWLDAFPLDRRDLTVRTGDGGNDEAAKRPLSSRDAVDQFFAVVYDKEDPLLLADMFGDRLTETGRLGVVYSCMQPDRQLDAAICQLDIDALDVHKVLAEVRAATSHRGIERMAIRVALQRVRGVLKQQPAVDAHALEVARTASRDWQQHAKTMTQALVMASAADDARVSGISGSACEETSRAAIEAVIARMPAKSFEGIVPRDDREALTKVSQQIVATPDGYLSAYAYTQCARRGSEIIDPLANFLAEQLVELPGARGPRTAAGTALVAAHLHARAVHRAWFEPHYRVVMGGAAVAAIKGATLRFVRESEKQRKGTDCQREVARVRPDGQVDYQDFCRGEKQVLVDVSHDDTKVSERDAKLVKPGMYVITTNDAVLATWAKGATHPSSVFGVELK